MAVSGTIAGIPLLGMVPSAMRSALRMIARMAWRMWMHRLAGPVGDWVFVLAFTCFMGWAVLFVADEPGERFQGIGMILSLVIVYTVRAPRLRRAKEIGEPHGTADLPTWSRRMTPVVLAVGMAFLVAVLVLGYWMAALLVGIGLFFGGITLVTHRSEDSRTESVAPGGSLAQGYPHVRGATREDASGSEFQPPPGASTPPPGWVQPPDWYPAEDPPQAQRAGRE